MKEQEVQLIKEYAEKHPKKKAYCWLCLMDKEPRNIWAAAKGYPLATEDEWGIFTADQNGYKWAKERYPYFYPKTVTTNPYERNQ